MDVRSRKRLASFVVAWSMIGPGLSLRAETPTPPAAGAPDATKEKPKLYFIVQFGLGPKWDPKKPPAQQLFFRQHSDNLRALRSSGAAVVGARYANKGLVIVQASSEEEARAYFEKDPAVQHGTFDLEIYPFEVFYSGCLGSK